MMHIYFQLNFQLLAMWMFLSVWYLAYEKRILCIVLYKYAFAFS